MVIHQVIRIAQFFYFFLPGNLTLFMVRKESFSCKLPNQTGCHFTVRLWSVLDFMSLFLRRKMEQFSLLQNRAPYISTHTGCLEYKICLFADILARVKAKKAARL